MLKRLDKVLRTGDFVRARTNAEFLNKTFGTEYKAWMKSVWNYNKDIFVWMVEFDGSKCSDWKNEFIDNDTIRETNVKGVDEWNGKPIDRGVPAARVVIEKQGEGFSRKYIFRGVFKTDEDLTNWWAVRVHKKVSDEFRY